MESASETQRQSPQEFYVPCKRHPTKKIEYVCLKPDCDNDRVYCTACVFKKSHCRHEDDLKDLDEFLTEQKKQLEMKGLLHAPHIYKVLSNKRVFEAEHSEKIKAQQALVDEEIDAMISDITQALEGIRKSVHGQLKLASENFRTAYEMFDYKIRENFASYYLSAFKSFQEVLDQYNPMTVSSLLELIDNLLRNYQEQFTTPGDLEAAYSHLMALTEESPRFEGKRLNIIKGHFDAFKDKLVQNITALINQDDEGLSKLNSTFMLNKSTINSINLSQRELNTTRINSPQSRSMMKRSLLNTDRGSVVSRSLSSVKTVDYYKYLKERDLLRSMPVVPKDIHKKVEKKRVGDNTFGPNRQPVEVRRLQLSTSFPTSHNRAVLSLVHLKDNLIASSSDDSLIKLWDISTFRCVKVLKGHTSGIRSLAMLMNGNLVSGSWDKTIKIWQTSELVNQYDGENTVIKIPDHSMTLKGHVNAVLTVHVLADGKTIASGSSDYQVKLWDSETGQCTKTLVGHTGEVLALAAKMDNKTIISAGGDRMIKIWDSEKKLNQCRDTLAGHSGPVWCIKLLSDDNTLISGSPDKMVKIWSIDKGLCLKTLLDHQNPVLNVGEFKDETFLSCDSEGVIKIWELATSTCVSTLQNKVGSIHAVAVTSDYYIIGAGADKRVYVWN